MWASLCLQKTNVPAGGIVSEISYRMFVSNRGELLEVAVVELEILFNLSAIFFILRHPLRNDSKLN